MSALVQQFVKKPDAAHAARSNPGKKKVNVLGIVPYMDSFWRGNLEGIRRSLELLGIEVNTYFTADDSLESLRASGDADLNIVVSDVYGIEVAAAYQKRFGIPYISLSLPVGPTATAALLRQTAGALALDADVNVEKIIEGQNKRYYSYLEPLIDLYHDADLQRYAVIVGDVNYAAGITRFLLDDLGWIPELVQFTELLSAAQQKALTEKLTGVRDTIDTRVVFDTNASEASRYIAEKYPRRETERYVESFSPAFVIGSALERSLALTLGVPHLSVSFPVANRAVLNRGYTGYAGALTLIEDLLSAIVAGR
jgi:nitrogenase molybdenum-iron protein beta chain